MYQLTLPTQTRIETLSSEDKKLIEFLKSGDPKNVLLASEIAKNQNKKHLLHHAWNDLRSMLENAYKEENINFATHYVSGGKFYEAELLIENFELTVFGWWVTEVDRGIANAIYQHNNLDKMKHWTKEELTNHVRFLLRQEYVVRPSLIQSLKQDLYV